MGWAHNNLGLLIHSRSPAEGIAELREAIRLNPNELKHHGNLIVVLQQDGKLAEAANACQAVLLLKPDNAWVRARLAGILLAQGKRDEAMAEYRQAIQLKPDDAEARNNTAWSMALPPDRPRREYDETAEHARKAIALAPKNGNHHNTLALIEYRLDHPDRAIAAAERSLALQGGNAWDWFFLAMALARKGEKDKAAQWFDKAVAQTKEKDPQNLQLRQFWAEAAKLLDRTAPDASSAAPNDRKPR